jgi:hypothetical protein
LASFDGGPLALFLVTLLVIVIGAGGLSIWLAIVRGRAYLVPVALVSMVLAVVWGLGMSALLTLLAAIGLSLLPAKPGSRWERHKARLASGDSDAHFFSPPMIILGIAAFPLVIGVVVVLIN